MARSFFQVRKRIYWLLERKDQVRYLWSAKGKIGADGYPRPYTEDEIRDIIRQDEEGHYTSNYTAAEREEIVRNSVGCYCFDCSGLTNWLTGETGYSREVYAKRTKETSRLEAPECSFIFTDFDQPNKRHIMLDAGQGYIIHVCKESCAKNRNSSHGDKTGLLLQTYDEWVKMWDPHTLHYFQTSAVDYRGALATDPNADPDPEPSGKKGRVVNCTALNMRTGPGTTYGVCQIIRDDGRGWRHTLDAGETVEIIGQQAGWYQITITGSGYTWTPWVSASYIQIID